MTKPQTPKLDQLRAMPAGLARSVFAEVNRATLGAEQRAIDAFEQQGAHRQETGEVETIRKAGLTNLAHVADLRRRGRGYEADIYEQAHGGLLRDQRDVLERIRSGEDDGPDAA